MTRQPLYNIPRGSILQLDGRDLKVSGHDESGYSVACQDTGECFTISIERVENAIRNRVCEVISPIEDEKHKALLAYTGGFDLVEQLLPDAQEVVRGRLALVLAQDELIAEGVKLTQRSMSKCGAHRKALLIRADKISPDCNFLNSRRGGKMARGFNVPQGRTLASYHRLYHKFDRNPVVLADRDHLKGRWNDLANGIQRLVSWQERFIDYVLNCWLDEKNPPLAGVYDGAKEVFHRTPHEIAERMEFPSITTLRNRVKAISEVVVELGRGGRQHATNKKGAGSTDIRALAFGEECEIDQCLLSIMSCGDGKVRAEIVDPNEVPKELADNEIRRCWLHVIIDVATREVLGWIISETADADHSKALLRMATRDKTKEKVRYGCKHDPVPAVRLGHTLADNGTATRNSEIYAAQLGMGMTVKTARAYQPVDKQIVERVFGTLQWEVLNFRPGYTGSRPGELTGYDPKASAKITHDDLYGTITRYFIDEYPFRTHRGTAMYGATPRQKREQAMARYGSIKPPSQRERILHFGVKSNATTTPEGVTAFNIPFNSTELQDLTAGTPQKVTVHLDPDDLRKVYVTTQGSKKAVPVNLSMTVLKDQSLEEAIEIMEAATKWNPTLRELHAQQLKEAKARRARESGFFPDSRDPANYQKIEKLRRRAAKLIQVEKRPFTNPGDLAGPGNLMSRSSKDGAIPARSRGSNQTASSAVGAVDNASKPQAAKTDHTAPESGAVSRAGTNDIKTMTFGPIKDSKL